MADLRKRLAAFHDEAEKILVALGDREWSHGPARERVEILEFDLEDIIHDLSAFVTLDEAWTEEE